PCRRRGRGRLRRREHPRVQSADGHGDPLAERADRPTAGAQAHKEATNMRIRWRIARALIVVAVLALVAAGAPPTPAGAEDLVLHMAVPDWPPTRIMKDLADKQYKAPSGNKVTLEPDFIPWPTYYERLAASLTSGEKKYQMAVSDSQWLGAFIEGGYYLKLNKYIDADPQLQAILRDIHPAVVDAYMTYPFKSKNYYGFPQMPDLLVVYY